MDQLAGFLDRKLYEDYVRQPFRVGRRMVLLARQTRDDEDSAEDRPYYDNIL